MVFAQVSSLPSVGAGSNFPIEGLQLFSRELGGLAKVDDAALISLDPCGRHLENPCVSCGYPILGTAHQLTYLGTEASPGTRRPAPRPWSESQPPTNTASVVFAWQPPVVLPAPKVTAA